MAAAGVAPRMSRRGERTLQANTIRIGEAVRHRGRRCYVVGIGPMSMPGRCVELEDAQTGKTSSAPLAELEPAGAGRTGRGYPVVKVTNMGRAVTVDRTQEGGDGFVFSCRGRPVAELHAVRTAERGLVEWRLRIPDRNDAVLASEAGFPPITAALFFVDSALAP
jgi:hypothetical protein